MADVEQLVARLSLDMRQFRSEMLKAQGVNAKAARDVENTWSRTNAKLNGFGKSMASGLIAPLTGIAAAASVREVSAYADAWTTAGNKLAAAVHTQACPIAREMIETKQRAVLESYYYFPAFFHAPLFWKTEADRFGESTGSCFKRTCDSARTTLTWIHCGREAGGSSQCCSRNSHQLMTTMTLVDGNLAYYAQP